MRLAREAAFKRNLHDRQVAAGKQRLCLFDA
jgi:hypothetical protein